MTIINFKKGSGLVEILISVFIFSMVLGALIFASNAYLSGAKENLNTTKAAYLAEEGVEAVKIMRDVDWTSVENLTDNTNYFLYFDTSSTTNHIWMATSTQILIDDFFTRTFKVNNVYRDSNGRIVTSGGTLDSNTKKLTVSISWFSKATTTVKVLSTYIANIL